MFPAYQSKDMGQEIDKINRRQLLSFDWTNKFSQQLLNWNVGNRYQK